MRFLSLSFYYLWHLSLLLCDAGVPFMYRAYNWCMLKSIDLDPDCRVWKKVSR